MPKPHHGVLQPPFWATISTFCAYSLLFVFGYVRDFFAMLFRPTARPPEGYAPLLLDFEDFYTRRLYRRIQDCWNRPISSCPGSWIDVMLRASKDHNKTLSLTGEERKCLNVGSYNYLGFGDPNSTTKPSVLKAVDKFGSATCSTRTALGTTTLHTECEELVARFVRKPSAFIFGMGFGTNSTGIPALVGKGGLLISDANNHSSIVAGARASGSQIRVFKHNDPDDLELVIRKAIIEGQPRTHRPWTKILIVVEGIYSMEGEICPLKEIVAIKKKYNCYLYVDEAHSIGALGQTGRGITEHAGVDPADVDVLMGTFTKSFGAVGGYIASSKEVVAHLRHCCAGSAYSQSISPPAVQQIISAFKIILGEDGTTIGKKKIEQLRDNSNYFRKRLINMGIQVLGDYDSPIVPIMLYCPTKMPAFSREMLEEQVAVVVVGFPATPLLLSRARMCISAAHTRKDLDFALEKLAKASDRLGFRWGSRFFG